MGLSAETGVSLEELGKFREQAVPETETYAIDWAKGRISGRISEREALHQYIYKALKTECNAYLIYDASYGCKAGALVRQRRASRAYLETDIPRIVKAALTDKRILGVRDFTFGWPEDERDCVRIGFVADTVYGAMREEVEV